MTELDGHSTSDMSDDVAKEIFQEVLDRLSAAVLDHDKSMLRDVIVLPTSMTTHNAEIVFETEEDWFSFTLRIHRGLHSVGVNHYIRLVQNASFLSENYIEGIYDTHSLRNAVPMAPSYANRSALSRIDGVWKLSMMEAALSNNRFPFTLPRLETYEQSVARPQHIEDDPRRSTTPPFEIYQSYLDALTEADFGNNFDAWCSLMEFPLGLHRVDVDDWIERPEQLRPYFDQMRLEDVGDVPYKVVRKASRAEFISATKICGYHQCLVLQGEKTVVKPVAARHILRRTGTKWRAVSVTNSPVKNEFPFSDDDLHTSLVSLKAIEERTGRK